MVQKRTKLEVTLVTGRTIEQGVGKEQSKLSKEYVDSAAVCYLDPFDVKKLSVNEKSNVQISTQHGTVVVKALRSIRTPHPQVVFVPYGPWANAVVDAETNSLGMPSLKGIPCTIEPAPDKAVLSLAELLKQQFGKEPTVAKR
jgi:formylmethanofuran dehydrogenase subunit D